MTVMAISEAKNNAELMVECRELGYLDDEWLTWDATYGLGTFWKVWRPQYLIGTDIDPDKSNGYRWGVDFTRSHWRAGKFEAVVFDPPYKLNGTSACPSDDRYGVASKSTWQDRHKLIYRGIDECLRVLAPNGMLLIKCQDQVSSGAVRWQTRLFAEYAEWDQGSTVIPEPKRRAILIDMLHLPSYRPQPEGRRQVHARRNYSTLLVLRKL